MDKLRTSAAPPPNGPEMWIRRLKANEEFHCTILSRRILGVYTHWAGKYSLPCTEPTADCLGHQKGYPQRWRAYLHVHDNRRPQHCVLELPKAACEQLTAQLGELTDWRGCRCVMKRLGGHQTRIHIELLPPHQQVSPAPLPAERDIIASIVNIFGEHYRREKAGET